MRPVRLGLVGGMLLVGVAAAPRDARAEGISVAAFGGEHGHPTTTNATAMYFNPAGIGMSEGTHVYADVSLFWRKVTYEHTLAPTDDGSVPGANDGRAKLFNIIPAPMLGATTKLGDLALGAAFYVPYGGTSIWSKNDAFSGSATAPGAADGINRWYVTSGTIRSAFVTVAGAYNIKPARLSIGVGANLILSTTDVTRAKTVAGNDASIPGEGRAYLHTTGTDWSLGIGVLYEAIEKKLWVGASYQSRPNLTGMKDQSGHQALFLPGQPQTDVPATLKTDIPDVFRLGFRYRPETDIELRLFGDYQRWSHMDHQVVTNTDNNSVLLDQDRSWKDTYGVRIGLSKWLGKKLEAFTGMGYTSNAVPDSTQEPALPDWAAAQFSLGGRYGITDKIFGAVSYTHLVFVPRDTTGKNTLTTAQGGAPPSPDAGGVYKQAVGILNVNMDVAF